MTDDTDTLLTRHGQTIQDLTLMAIRAYGAKFPDAAAGLVADLTAGELRMRVVTTFGGGEPLVVTVEASVDGAVLEVARLVIAKPGP